MRSAWIEVRKFTGQAKQKFVHRSDWREIRRISFFTPFILPRFVQTGLAMKYVPLICTALCASVGLFGPYVCHAATPVNTIPGDRGIRISGTDQGFGISMSSIGDINGDGLIDLAIGAPAADRTGANDVGAVYVVFGRSNVSSNIDVSTLNGSDGFKVTGNSLAQNSGLGTSVAAIGDVNNDKRADFIIGTPSDRAFVIFGAASFAASLDVSALSGNNGLTLTAATANDRFGDAVAGGSDVNGDGIDDFVVGAPLTNSVGALGGRAYVFYGRATFPATLSATSATGSAGFVINPVAGGDLLGFSVAMGRDINNDGRDDLAVASISADLGANGTGSAYVIFGRPTSAAFPASLSVSSLDGSSSSGFALRGAAANDGFGVPVVFAGDVNGDDVGDLVAGAASNGSNGAGSGQTCVLFGRGAGFDAVINANDLDGADGYCLNGEAANDASGEVLAAGIDINNDGINDLIISAGDRYIGANANAGRIYVVLGTNAPRNARYGLNQVGSTDLPGEVFDGVAPNQRITTTASIGKFTDTSNGVFAIGDPINGSVYVVTRASDRIFRSGFEN